MHALKYNFTPRSRVLTHLYSTFILLNILVYYILRKNWGDISVVNPLIQCHVTLWG